MEGEAKATVQIRSLGDRPIAIQQHTPTQTHRDRVGEGRESELLAVNWSPSWLVASEAATIMVICSEPVSDPWGTHDSALHPLLTVSVSSSCCSKKMS